MITSRGIHMPYDAHHGDVLVGIRRKHGSRASARGPRPGAPWWFCDGQSISASPGPKRPSQATCQSIPYRLLGYAQSAIPWDRRFPTGLILMTQDLPQAQIAVPDWAQAGVRMLCKDRTW